MPTLYTVQWNPDPANSSRRTPHQFLPACFSSDLRKSQDRVWRRLEVGALALFAPPPSWRS